MYHLTFMQSWCFGAVKLGKVGASWVSAVGIWDLEATVGLPIDSTICFGGEELRLWTDPQYSVLPISTPDFLEKRLMELVATGRAEYALDWYLRRHPKPLCQRLTDLGENLVKFPHRYSKFLYMKNNIMENEIGK